MVIKKSYNSHTEFYKDLHDMWSKGYRVKKYDTMTRKLIIIHYFK